MEHVDIMQADREQLVDISDIHIDISKEVDSRVQEYLEQVGNPYLVKYGDYIIKFQYADSDHCMDERMMEYISKMAKIRY